MDKNIKENWIKVLKSGKYEQGQLQLKQGNEFCCLGVLCDVLIKEKKTIGYWNELDNFVVKDKNEGIIENECNLLPNEIQKVIQHNSSDFQILDFQIKFPKLCEEYELEDSNYSLAELNDCGLTFNEIADIIETEL